MAVVLWLLIKDESCVFKHRLGLIVRNFDSSVVDIL